MTWTLVFALGAGAYLCKVVGLVVVGTRPLPAVVDRCLVLIPAALVTALVVKDTFSTGQELVLDARAVGVAAAALAVWRRLPFLAVIAIGAGVTAAVRAVG